MDTQDSFRSAVTPNGHSSGILSLALLLLAVTVATSTGVGLWQSLSERTTLRQAMANLEQPHQQAGKLRGQVEGIARQVARLADQGNPNAREIVEALRRQGISINPN